MKSRAGKRQREEEDLKSDRSAIFPPGLSHTCGSHSIVTSVGMLIRTDTAHADMEASCHTQTSHPALDSSCLKLLSPSLQTCQPSTAGHKFDRLFCSIGGFTYYLSVTSLTPLVHFPHSFRHFDSRPFTGCC